MKILHVSTFDRINGASIAAYRLHRGLLASGFDSAMWVQNKVSDDPTVFGPRPGLHRFWNRCRPWLDRLPLGLVGAFGDYMVSAGWLPRFDTAPVKEWQPDLIHLHWVQGGFIPIGLLRKWKHLPVFWTFHDEWAFSGLRHYKNTGIESAPGLLSRWDNRLRRRKAGIYGKVSPVGVAPSKWIREQAEASEVWKGCETHVLPNPIDTGVFRPGDKAAARERLGLPKELPLILFGAEAGTSDRRKGFDLLREACRTLSGRGVRFGLVCFGNGSPGDLGEVPCFSLGWIGSDEELVAAYTAADLAALPSRMDNLPNTGAESIACGRPVVSFAVGGIPDIVENGVSGYLCEPEAVEDFAGKVEELVGDESLRERMGEAARVRAEERFSCKVLVPKFLRMYSSR